MTKERAQYLLKNVNRYGGFRWAFPNPLMKPPYYAGHFRAFQIEEDGITIEEFEFVKIIWTCMTQNKSFHDAVKVIAET